MFLDKWQFDQAYLVNDNQDMMVEFRRRLGIFRRWILRHKPDIAKFRGRFNDWYQYPSGFPAELGAVRVLNILWQTSERNKEWTKQDYQKAIYKGIRNLECK